MAAGLRLCIHRQTPEIGAPSHTFPHRRNPHTLRKPHTEKTVKSKSFFQSTFSNLNRRDDQFFQSTAAMISFLSTRTGVKCTYAVTSWVLGEDYYGL